MGAAPVPLSLVACGRLIGIKLQPKSVFLYTDATEVGGAERVLLSLLEHLDRDAWTPSLMCRSEMSAGGFATQARARGAAVIVVPALPLGMKGARAALGLTWRLRRSRPDVFHAHLAWPMAGKFALAAAVAAGVPATIATIHSVPVFTLDRSNRVQLRLLSRRIGAYVAISKPVASALCSMLGYPVDRTRVIANGVDPAASSAATSISLRQSLAPDERPIILTAARLVADKGVRYLIEAAPKLPGAVIVVAGDGPERRDLELLARNLGVADRVRLLGHRDDIADLIAVCDVFVLPTLWEGVESPSGAVSEDDGSAFLPLSVLEAMAASKPVVMARIAAGDAIVDDVNGLHVPPRDSPALAAAIARLLSDDDLRHRIGVNGGATVRANFELERTVEATEDLYRELLARR